MSQKIVSNFYDLGRRPLRTVFLHTLTNNHKMKMLFARAYYSKNEIGAYEQENAADLFVLCSE